MISVDVHAKNINLLWKLKKKINIYKIGKIINNSKYMKI